MSDARANSCMLFRKRGPLRIIAIITLWSFFFTTGGGDVLLERLLYQGNNGSRQAWAVETPLELSSVSFALQDMMSWTSRHLCFRNTWGL